MQRTGRLSALLVLPMATILMLAGNANADELGIGSLIHPTLPSQPMFPPGSKRAEKSDKAPTSTGKFSLKNSVMPGKDGESLWALQVHGMSLRAVLEKLVTDTGKQIIIVGEMSGDPVILRYNGLTLTQLIESLCQDFDLTLKHITKDLYVIIPPKTTETQFTRPDLPGNIPPLVPPGWRDFKFNGKTYFVVPLLAKDRDSDMATTSKPLRLDRVISHRTSKQVGEGKPQDVGSIVPLPVILSSR